MEWQALASLTPLSSLFPSWSSSWTTVGSWLAQFWLSLLPSLIHSHHSHFLPHIKVGFSLNLPPQNGFFLGPWDFMAGHRAIGTHGMCHLLPLPSPALSQFLTILILSSPE